MTWLLGGFMFTYSYKSVLLANIVINDYEKSIDTVEDMLASGMTFVTPRKTMVPILLLDDPRAEIKKLMKQMIVVNFLGNKYPKWVYDGQVF